MKIIAHRGASGQYPENTLQAFEQAIKQHCDGIELDVQYHHSKQLVIVHDSYVDKTTDGQGQVNDFSLEQLQALDAGNDQHIPTLDQALKMINGQCLLNIEIKSAATDVKSMEQIILTLVDNITIAIEKYQFRQSQFILSSFNHHLIAAIKALHPQLTVSALTASCPISYAEFAQHLNAFAVNVAIESVNADFVTDAHNRGLEVWVYTVDNKTDIARCHNIGVDGIFTNFPKRSRLILNALATE